MSANSMCIFKFILLSLISLGFQFAHAQDASDCVKVLAKDQYFESKFRNLKSDYLKSINQGSWQELKRDGTVNMIFDEVPIGASFSEFDTSRNTYLSNEHYTRTENEATTIINTVTSDRAYNAYEACLLASESGPPLRVWATKETMNEIQLRIYFRNPPSVKGIYLKGTVEGGSVAGAKPKFLWNNGISGKGLRLGVNEQKLIVIKRTPGHSTTSITITPSDGSPAISLSFSRADAIAKLMYDGSFIFVRNESFSSPSVATPNNDHAYNLTCPRHVYQTGNICTSRTEVSYRTQPAFFITSGQLVCEGVGCSFVNRGAVTFNADRTIASSYIDNWGPPVQIYLNLSLSERVGENGTSCGNVEAIPIIKNIPIVFTVKKDCQGFAKIKWTSLTDGGQGIVNFNFEDGAFKKASETVTTPTSSTISVGYKLVM